jgi:tripartite-type tricarboxylate transporter receptor subunit TctC
MVERIEIRDETTRSLFVWMPLVEAIPIEWYGAGPGGIPRPKNFQAGGDDMRRRDFLALVCGAITVGAASCPLAASAAEAWPTRPITIIVPFGAGSGTDIVTRIIGQPLGIALGQNIVVDNRQGANGGIAAAYVAKAPPDGYTLLMSTNSPHSANPFLLKNIAYDPVKDFAPVTRIGSFTLMFVINPTLPVKTIPELITYAKANPGKLTYGSGNTSGILAGETLKHWAGIDILQVPYKSVPPALNDVIAGRVSMTFTDLTPGLPHVTAGSLRALGITRLKRSVLLPDLPTFDESGLKDFEVESWAGLFAPAGTPVEIVNRLNAETRKIVENPQIKAQIAQIGFEVFGSTPEELGAFVKDQLVRTSRMVKDAGIEPE